jgi:alpha-aminoadipic semialdehyde synthase
MLGNGIIGIQRESNSKVWERRAPLTPSHCAQLLHAPRRSEDGHVKHILVQPSTKRIFQDTEYENVGCEISEDLSECGLILGVKQPEVLLDIR